MKEQLWVLFLLVPAMVSGQVTVKGIVTEQNSNNKPLAGVQIKALGSAPEQSDQAGLFRLLFNTKKPGDRIVVSEISKPGYEIVNKDVVNNWVILNDPNARTRIVLCPAGQVAQNTLKYYDISLTGLTEGYKRKNEELQEKLKKSEIDAKSYSEQAKTLAEQYENQQKKLEELAEKFARENFDECSEVHRRAFESFTLGKIEEAIVILESVNSEAEILKAKQQQAKARSLMAESDSIIAQNIKKLLFQADLYESEFRFEDAKMAYKTAIEGDTTLFEPTYAFVRFLVKQREFKECSKWLDKAITVAKTDVENARVKYMLALILHYQNQLDKAEVTYGESLDLWRTLAASNPDGFNLELQNTLNSIGIFYSDQNQLKKSEEYALEALSITRAMADGNGELQRRTLVNGLTNLGLLEYRMNQFEKSDSSYHEALQISRELVASHPGKYDFELAWSLSGMAYAKGASHEPDSADLYYDEALIILRKLSASNPQRYNSYFAVLLNSIANHRMHYRKNQSADSLFQEAYHIIEDLVKINPSVYNPLYASAFNNLGVISNIQNRNDQSEIYLEKALIEYRALAAENPKAYLVYVGWVLNNLGDIQKDMKQFDESEASLQEAIGIFREMAKTDSIEAKRFLSTGLFNYADLCFQLGKTKDFISVNEEALRLSSEMARANPRQMGLRTVLRYGHYSRKLMSLRMFEEAEQAARKGYETDTSMIWIKVRLAEAMLFQGKYSEAKNICLDIKDKEYPLEELETCRNAILKDLDDLEKEGITHRDVKKIRKELAN